MGRRKVEMKKIVNKSSRLVTFSKRRSGLFKKANEISTLCAAEVAIIVFSPGGKPFSFGQPNVEKLVHSFRKKYRQKNQSHEESTLSDAKYKKGRVHRLNQELINLEAKIDMENKRSEKLEKKEGEWKFQIEELEFNQLLILQNKLQHVFEGSTSRVSDLEASTSLLLLADASSSSK